MTKKEAREVVVSFDNCTVRSFENNSDQPLCAFINVPESQEKEYVRHFENHTAVESANRLERHAG